MPYRVLVVNSCASIKTLSTQVKLMQVFDHYQTASFRGVQQIPYNSFKSSTPAQAQHITVHSMYCRDWGGPCGWSHHSIQEKARRGRGYGQSNFFTTRRCAFCRTLATAFLLSSYPQVAHLAVTALALTVIAQITPASFFQDLIECHAEIRHNDLSEPLAGSCVRFLTASDTWRVCSAMCQH